MGSSSQNQAIIHICESLPWVSKSFDTVTFFEAGLQIHRIPTKFGGFGPSNGNTTLPKKFCEILKTREAPSSFVALGEI